MTLSRVDAIANAVLYEGYMLYPYRPSAVKNQQRFNFGVVSPEAKPQSAISSELSCLRTECLLQGNEASQVEMEVRFLQLVQRDLEIPQDREGGTEFVAVGKVELDGRMLSTWQEAVERRVAVGPLAISALLGHPVYRVFSFSANRETEPIYNQDGELAARFVRHRESLSGRVEFSAERVAPELFKISASIVNDSAFSEAAVSSHEQAMLSSFLSTHKVLRSRDGQFISLTDPPEAQREAAASCKNVGTWPVLASERAENSDVLLSSPIILYDYPAIAPESAGDLFDGTEIDEILALRILTMTDEEKREMRSVDDRTRAVLERTELLGPEHFLKLHGVIRETAPADEERS
jgi:hydrogenase maturation protease